MKLYSTLKSPFVRKVRVTALEKGLYDRIELVDGHPMNNPPELLAANPLGKIPALVLDNGMTLYDSKVICEYLDGLNDTPQLIPANDCRLAVLNLAALADGMMDAAVAIVMEGMRPEEHQSPLYIERQREKIARSLKVAEQELGGIPQDLNLAKIALAVSIEYLQKRTPELAAIAAAHTGAALHAWSAEFCRRASMQSTTLPE